MSKARTLAAWTLTASILGAIAAAIWFGLGRLRQAFDALEPQTAVVVAIASSVALLGALVIAVAIRSAKHGEIESRRQSERTQICVAVMESLEARLCGAPAPLDDGDRAAVERSVLEKALFLKGTEAVVKEYRATVGLLASAQPEVDRINTQVNRLLLAMRRDCGSTTYGLQNQDWSEFVRYAARSGASVEG